MDNPNNPQHGGDWHSFIVEQGREPFDFSISLNPLGLSQKVKEALKREIDKPAAYPDTNCTELTTVLSNYERVEPSKIVVGNGAADLIYRISAMLKPNKALLLAPTFSAYESALKLQGTEITYHLLKEEDNFKITEDILDALTEDIGLFFLCNPNNPTGSLINPELACAILNRCKQKDIILIVDECFIELSKRPQDTFVQHLESYGKLIVIKALTKSHALAGLRLGYALFADEDTALKVRRASQAWSVSSFAQIAGVAALSDENYMPESDKLIVSERNRIEAHLFSLKCRVFLSDSNFIFFFTPKENIISALNKNGIMIRDCSNFEGLDKGYYRIGLRTRDENDILLKALSDAINESPEGNMHHIRMGEEQ